MTARSDDDFDPRFDPAFQRGFDKQRAPESDDRKTTAPRIADSRPREARPVSRESYSTGPYSSAPYAAAPSVAQPPTARGDSVAGESGGSGRSGSMSADSGPTDSGPTDAAAPEDRPSRPNPFLIALGVVSVALVAAGVWAIQAAREPFLATDAASNVDYVGLQILQILAPVSIALGVATAIGIVFVLAVGWQKRG